MYMPAVGGGEDKRKNIIYTSKNFSILLCQGFPELAKSLVFKEPVCSAGSKLSSKGPSFVYILTN